jgi:voltage-gated potassium channel
LFWPRTARPTAAAASSPTDALYFTLTVFSTLGFGDITATSQSATVIVMVQMVLDLVILGLGVQVYRGAVSMGRN